MSAVRVVHLLTGPSDHGVVRFGAALAGRTVHLEDPDRPDPGLVAALTGMAPGVIHLQYTDALYGSHTSIAAEVFTRLCRQLRDTVGVPLTATLHDLPDPADDPARYDRRARSYRRVAAALDGVMVSSDHEARLLRALTADSLTADHRITVIPLPIGVPALTPSGRRPEPRPEVAVFGFLYPGKGHQDVITAMSDLPARIGFTALGRAADGHEDLAETLTARSDRACVVTGFVPDDELTGRLQRVAVPVAPARMVSASGSINTWIEAGRRPLVAHGPYTAELARRYPGALHLYQPDELSSAIRAALADRDRTWLTEPPPDGLGAAATARAYTDAFAALCDRQPVTR